MKFARTIQLDSSDQQVFEQAARPEEWAIVGTFEFQASAPDGWSRKHQLAFKSGWLGLDSFGRSTFVQIATIPEGQFDAAVRALAAHIFDRYGAPDMLAATEAARKECQDMADLCDHPVGTLLAVERDFNDDGIVERVKVIPATGDEQHAKIWSLETDADDADQAGD